VPANYKEAIDAIVLKMAELNKVGPK
jgi:hypothetical protein